MTQIRIEGLAELQRAFALVSKGLSSDLREGLKSAAEPVESDAESLARSTIKTPRNIDWTAMRTGVTRTLVYVAPVARGDTSRRGSRRRRNFKSLMLERALEPALERNKDKVVREVDDVMRDLARSWARV